MDGIAHDQIFIILPDGREVIGRALQVNDPISIPSGSGEIKAKFQITVPTPMEVAAVLMMLDKPMRERILLPKRRLL